MLTPQEIDQLSFGHATFGGYDIHEVDAILGPLTEDYVTLYKENTLLKSKMKVLVNKLEEYRANESSMKDAIVNAQKTCDKMVREAEEKCTRMLTEANAAATQNAKNADALIAAENERVEEARQTAHSKIEELQSQLQSCLQALERIKEANRPIHKDPAIFDFQQTAAACEDIGDRMTEAVAQEISANVEALVGTVDTPACEPDPMSDTSTRFSNLQFGRNYNPTGHN